MFFGFFFGLFFLQPAGFFGFLGLAEFNSPLEHFLLVVIRGRGLFAFFVGADFFPQGSLAAHGSIIGASTGGIIGLESIFNRRFFPGRILGLGLLPGFFRRGRLLFFLLSGFFHLQNVVFDDTFPVDVDLIGIF